jgi:hypothetical protein
VSGSKKKRQKFRRSVEINIGNANDFVQCKMGMEGMQFMHGPMIPPGKVPASACLSSLAVSDCGENNGD